METEGVKLVFTDDAIDALADVAVEVNDSVENIGARRLQTVMERVLDEISFTAPDRSGETVTVDAAYVATGRGAWQATRISAASSFRRGNGAGRGRDPIRFRFFAHDHAL